MDIKYIFFLVGLTLACTCISYLFVAFSSVFFVCHLLMHAGYCSGSILSILLIKVNNCLNMSPTVLRFITQKAKMNEIGCQRGNMAYQYLYVC